MATASAPEILETPRATEPQGLYEVVGGQIVEKPPMGSHEGVLASVLFKIMARTPDLDDAGWLVCEVLFQLDREGATARCPDLAFVSFDRWPRNRPIPRRGAWKVVPDLAIEVVSPTNRTEDDFRKVRDYFEAGVRQVWMVLPDLAQVHVFHSPSQIQSLGRSDTLDGGNVLPGFQIALNDLFLEI